MKPQWACWALVLIVFKTVALGADLTIPIPRLPQPNPDEKKLAALIESGDFAQAISEAKKLSMKSPDALGSWLFLGAVAAQDGDFDQAISSLTKGLRNRETDLPFLIMLARIHEDRATLGPGGARTRGMVSYSAAGLKQDAVEFGREQYRLAAQRFQRVVELAPEVPLYQAKHASLLLSAGDFESAEKQASTYLKTSPDAPLVLLQHAKAALELGRWAEAKADAARCVTLLPVEPESYRVLSRVASHEGDDDGKKDWERKAEFYAFVPTFLTVPYTDKNAAVVTAVTFQPTETQTKEEIAEKSHAGEAAINELISDSSPESSRLLGLIAWHHGWHGSVENRIYGELERRGDEAVLMALFEHAQSFCTVGSCAPILAKLKSDAAFPLILERLPTDRNPFIMGLPEALTVYHRAEAIPVLGKTILDALGEPSAREPMAFMAEVGKSFLVSRCLWALSTFEGKEAQSYLETAARKKEFAAEATAALMIQSKDSRHFKTLLKLVKRDPAQAKDIADHFKSAGLKEADAIYALVPPEKPKRK